MNGQIKKKIVSILLITAFTLNYITIPAFAATATADPNAATENRPNITEQNGVTVVDIAGPNANGLSHNKYLDFNVDQKGLILNNSLTNTNTQLAGNITANNNLDGRQATVILNEVTGGNPSQINGLIEVAGQRADVIIANPNGIAGSGFGFINVNRAIFVTGQPSYQDDKLNFNITGGQVAIGGDGLNYEYQPSKFETLTRAAQINAEVWAQEEINIITGTNKIDYETLNIQPIETSNQEKPLVALDIGAIGGMYSGKIKLIGTEQGLGVNILGEIDAQNSLTLDNQGKLTMAGQINGTDFIAGSLRAGEDITVKTTGGIENTGEISSNKNINITAVNLTNNGMILAGEAEVISDDEDEAIIYAPAEDADLKVNVTGKISGPGVYSASKNISFTGENISYSGINMSAEKLLVNGTEKNIEPISGEPE